MTTQTNEQHAGERTELIRELRSAFIDITLSANKANKIAALLEADAQRQALKPLTERELIRCIADSGCIGTVKMSFESGPYSIDRPTINATRLCLAIEAAHGIKEKQ